MFARAASGTVIGVDAHPVWVETYRGKGLPGVALIGLARGAVRESMVRVRAAIMASGLQLGPHRLVANLLPAELPKEGSALDAALAVSLLASAGLLSAAMLEGRRFFGELSLGGAFEPVRGAVVLADLARRHGDAELIVPAVNAPAAAVIPGVRIIGVRSLEELVQHLTGRVVVPAQAAPLAAPAAQAEEQGCFSEVCGQPRAKRALEIAAAGGHNVLMIGPPGSGKTMLARRLSGILPPLSPVDCIEVTRIQSAAGLLQGGELVRARPFRSPHHTASEPALCGGGTVPRPGEITLAHRGVLFLDELPEFSRKALESLREPLEEGFIHIARASMSLTFPAQVLLLAAMNPCPCGRFRGDGAKRSPPGAGGPDAAGAPHRSGPPCLCSFEQIQRYRSRVSGPLLDRIDMHVLVDAVPYRDYAKRGTGETSGAIGTRVAEARARQLERFGSAGQTNACMNQKQLRQAVELNEQDLRLIERAIEQHGLSTRAIGKILKVARTIADLADRDQVQSRDIEEAIAFRILDRNPIASEHSVSCDSVP